MPSGPMVKAFLPQLLQPSTNAHFEARVRFSHSMMPIEPGMAYRFGSSSSDVRRETRPITCISKLLLTCHIFLDVFGAMETAASLA